MIPIRISFYIPMTISSLIFHGVTGVSNIMILQFFFFQNITK